MLYTVKDISSLSGVTVKTLHHYHRIGLLMPREISETGYRLYGTRELERLQQILFYRELEVPLKQIERLLEGEPERMTILAQQEELLLLRKQKLDHILHTLGQSISNAREGKPMTAKEMFNGFGSEEEWEGALQEQREHLQDTYGFDLLEENPVIVPDMNEQAAEAAAFMQAMAEALRTGVKHNDAELHAAIRDHLAFLNRHGHSLSAADFAGQTRFFLSDDFHLQMLEGQQTGLAYYMAAAAESYAAAEDRG